MTTVATALLMKTICYYWNALKESKAYHFILCTIPCGRHLNRIHDNLHMRTLWIHTGLCSASSLCFSDPNKTYVLVNLVRSKSSGTFKWDIHSLQSINSGWHEYLLTINILLFFLLIWSFVGRIKKYWSSFMQQQRS